MKYDTICGHISKTLKKYSLLGKGGVNLEFCTYNIIYNIALHINNKLVLAKRLGTTLKH